MAGLTTMAGVVTAARHDVAKKTHTTPINFILMNFLRYELTEIFRRKIDRRQV
jgi:hypothetical protein